MEYMTLKKANNELEGLENALEYYLDTKALSNKTKATLNLGNESSNRGKREDKFLKYVIKNEDVDPIIDFLQDKITITMNFIDKELKRLGKYEETERLVIYYKEEYIPKEISYTKEKEKITWEWISNQKGVYASVSTLKRINRKHKKKRYIED